MGHPRGQTKCILALAGSMNVEKCILGLAGSMKVEKCILVFAGSWCWLVEGNTVVRNFGIVQKLVLLEVEDSSVRRTVAMVFVGIGKKTVGRILGIGLEWVLLVLP